ncbi:hypothetical protein Lalb_Chr01g0019581 [Lupinus albus]|uniref:Uncharacterized protein n=1 Tax=Lupinus albus TaxID=3870 RepID=A0A6A4R9F4_LUPAL|nr:hypothetical protein Lalb_Chr01g0019581 [Lupinus albus]
MLLLNEPPHKSCTRATTTTHEEGKQGYSQEEVGQRLYLLQLEEEGSSLTLVFSRRMWRRNSKSLTRRKRGGGTIYLSHFIDLHIIGFVLYLTKFFILCKTIF